jgi:hypothetical protein
MWDPSWFVVVGVVVVVVGGITSVPFVARFIDALGR